MRSGAKPAAKLGDRRRHGATSRVIELAVAKRGHQGSQEPIRDPAQSAAVAMAALSQALVVRSGTRLALHRDPSPVVERCGELRATGPTHLHGRPTLFARALGHRGGSCQPP